MSAVPRQAAGADLPPLRVGVIGVGRIGRLHAALLARQVPGAALACVHDTYRAGALAVGAEFGVAVAEAADDIFAATDVDAVAVCSSTDSHTDLIVAAARAGKAIFCEKPVSLELAALDRALAEVRDAGVPFQIGFNRRFDPAHQSVRDAVADGTIGEIQLLRISSRDPVPPPLEYVKVSGGIFLDMTIHDFDMARYVTGSEVVEVHALGARRIEPAYAEADDVDTALVMMEHESGCLTTIDNSRRAVYGFDQRVEAFGSLGVAISENPPAHSTVIRTADGSHAARLPHFFLDRYVPSYVRGWEAFVAAVRGGAAPSVGPADARAPLVIGLAAWRSLREHRPVRVAEFEAAVPAARSAAP